MRQKPCADIKLGVLPAYRDKVENTDFSCATEEVALQGTYLENNCMRRCMQNRRALAARRCSVAPAKGYAKSMPRPKFKTSRFLFPVVLETVKDGLTCVFSRQQRGTLKKSNAADRLGLAAHNNCGE